VVHTDLIKVMMSGWEMWVTKCLIIVKFSWKELWITQSLIVLMLSEFLIVVMSEC
jgi:hypothetical protein